jgi:WbqC-like protein family
MATSQQYVNLLPYWPSINWCATYIQLAELPLYNGIYQKNYKLNQVHIAGANGQTLLSIPLEGGRQQQVPVADVRIVQNTNWQRQHLSAIQSAYGRAPYFDELWPQIENIYKTNTSGTLQELNLKILSLIDKILKHNCSIASTLNHQDFLACNAVQIQYQQVFMHKIGFLNNLSILDLLMNEGPYAKQLLINASKLAVN